MVSIFNRSYMHISLSEKVSRLNSKVAFVESAIFNNYIRPLSNNLDLSKMWSHTALSWLRYFGAGKLNDYWLPTTVVRMHTYNISSAPHKISGQPPLLMSTFISILAHRYALHSYTLVMSIHNRHLLYPPKNAKTILFRK